MTAPAFMVALAALLLALEVPVAVALGLSGTAAIVLFNLGPLLTVPFQVLGSLDSFTLLAVPMFLVAGNLLGHGETSRALIEAIGILTRRLRGGLGLVAVVASLLLAGISGSGPADVAALSLVLFGPLVAEGFKKEDAAALLAAGGGIGIIVPPSIALIIFGLVGDVSVERLFLAGVFPGMLVSGALACVVIVIARRTNTEDSGGTSPSEQSVQSRGVMYSLLRSLGALAAPGLMLGGLYSGLFADATESRRRGHSLRPRAGDRCLSEPELASSVRYCQTIGDDIRTGVVAGGMRVRLCLGVAPNGRHDRTRGGHRARKRASANLPRIG